MRNDLVERTFIRWPLRECGDERLSELDERFGRIGCQIFEVAEVAYAGQSKVESFMRLQDSADGADQARIGVTTVNERTQQSDVRAYENEPESST